MDLKNLKDDLHNHILQTGDEIYDQRITKGQIDSINASKNNFRNVKRFENNKRIQFRLSLIRDRYECEIEFLKHRYTEMYYHRKKRIEKLLYDGLPIMVVYLIQKLDHEFQSEYKILVDQLRHDMDGDFKILLNCVLERKTKELTESIEQEVEAMFQKDLALVYKMWKYGMNNIKSQLNASICENIVRNIYIVCGENSKAKCTKWQLCKNKQVKIDIIKKHVRDIKQWKPQLAVCPNIEIWRKHFKKILKQFQKYFNFYNFTHEEFDVVETGPQPDDNDGDQSSKSERKLNATPSAIFAAFDCKQQCLCTGESNIHIVTNTNVIPIRTICTNEAARKRKDELDKLKKALPSDHVEVNWFSCDEDEDSGVASVDYITRKSGMLKDAKNSIDNSNLLTDLLQLIDPEFLAARMLTELSEQMSALKFDTNINLLNRITNLLKHEIEHKLNSEETLKLLNGVLGPAYEAVRMKRISALSYIRDSMTILKYRNAEYESVFVPPEEQPNSVHNRRTVCLKISHQEYMNSFRKLPTYLFPQRDQPPFNNVYQIACIADFAVCSADRAKYMAFEASSAKKEFDRAKKRNTSILKVTKRDKLQPFYKMTVRRIINELNVECERESSN